MRPTVKRPGRVLAVALVVVCTTAFAGQPAPIFESEPAAAFVSIRGETSAAERAAWCGIILETFYLSGVLRPPQRCLGAEPPRANRDAPGAEVDALELARRSGRYALHVSLEVDPSGPMRLEVVSWTRGALQGADRFSWTLPEADTLQRRAELQERLREALRHPRVDRRTAGIVLDDLLQENHVGNREYGGLALDLGVLLLAGATWYVLDTDTNSADWRYPYALSTIPAKLQPEAFYLDDNTMFLNSPGHPLAGMTYYLSGRAHHLGMLGAFLGSAAGTVAWEYFAELREPVSLNDLWFTPVGGLALGEPMHQLSRFFAESDDTPLNRFLSLAFAGPTSLTPWSNPSRPWARLLDASGYPARGYRRIQLAAGMDVAGVATHGRPGGSLEFSADQVHRPEFDQPGNSATALVGPLATSLYAHTSIGSDGVLDAQLRGEVAYAGIVGRTASPGERLRSAFWAGISSVYEHQERLVGDGYDRFATAAIAGPAAAAHLSYGPWSLRMRAGLHPGFGLVTSRAFATRAEFDPELLPEVLVEQGYLWAYALRTQVDAELTWGGTEVGVEARSVAFSAAEAAGGDRRWMAAAWLSHRLPEGVLLQGRAEQVVRSGDLGSVFTQQADWRLVAQVAVRL